RELVSIPSVLVVSTVSIDRTKHASIRSYLQFMLESMASKGCMVYLNVDFKVIQQIVLPQETDYCIRIEVVMVLSQHCRLRLHEYGSSEAMLASIVYSSQYLS